MIRVRYEWAVWDFKRLHAWQRTRAFTVDVYSISRTFPDDERFGLSGQLKRAANSIGANIAEACGRPGSRERAQLLAIAIASTEEVHHHLTIAADVGLLRKDTADTMLTELDEIRRMVKALRERALSGL